MNIPDPYPNKPFPRPGDSLAMEGILEMWQTDSGFLPPSIEIAGKDLAIAIALLLKIHKDSGSGDYCLTTEGQIARHVKITIDLIEP